MVCGALAVIALFAVLAVGPQPAHAHPLGNFTINRYSRIEIGPDAVGLLYILDMAEVPAFQEIRAIDTNQNRLVDPDEESAYLTAKVDEIRGNLVMSIDGSGKGLKVAGRALTFPPGQGGLATLRIEARFEVPWAPGEDRTHTLAYEDRNMPDRLGWKEVVVREREGVSIESSSAPAAEQSDELRSYPEDSLASPLDVRSATVIFTAPAGTGTAAHVPGSSAVGAADAADAIPAPSSKLEPARTRRTDPLGELLHRDRLTPGVIALALVIAAGVGGFHALTPGHGKTIMAAYLVGARGAARHAVMLGGTVAISHTIGVLGLGLITVYAANVLAPETVYPYLGFGAGAIVLAIGVWMLMRRLSRGRGSGQGDGHNHDHGHEHGGANDSHDSGHEHHHQPGIRSGVTWRTLLAIGLADGAVPSASALILWLAAISIDRVEFGIVMVAAFGVGMAAALTAIGFLLVRGRGAFETRVAARFPIAHRLNHAIPWITAIVVIGAGLFLVVRAARETGLF